MPIPELDEDGELPPGRHVATREELLVKFVYEAPHVEHRQRIFRALMAHAARMRVHFPVFTMWIDGGFVTHKKAPPKDVDVAYFVDPASVSESLTDEELNALITHVDPWRPRIDVQTHAHVGFDPIGRIQPAFGLMDAFVVRLGDPVAEEIWHRNWSRQYEPGLKPKGYLEVVDW